MSNFVDIYLSIVKRSTLKDEIVVEELPKEIQEELKGKEEHLATLLRLKKKDDKKAKVLLERLKKRIEKDDI